MKLLDTAGIVGALCATNALDTALLCVTSRAKVLADALEEIDNSMEDVDEQEQNVHL